MGIAIATPTLGVRTGVSWRARWARVAAVGALVGGLGATTFALTPPERGDAPGVPMATVDPGIPSAGMVEIVVQGRVGGSAAALAEGIRAAGGEILTPLPIVDGFEVRVDAGRIDALAGQAGVVAITLDRAIDFETVSYDETGTASAFVGASRAHDAWRAGHLGQGIGVAVLDTGVSEMPDFAGRLVHGPDLSGEGKLIDSYGHGTVMAGIIAGSGADSAGRAGGAYTGIAPKAHIVAVKTAGANGAADVSTLLQGMHWVSAYQDQFDIRVLNLSWGTTSTQDPAVDPLNYAVQRLWTQGIVVVVAAGNTGPNASTIMKPGDDPLVITAGAFNDNGTAGLHDDGALSWSSIGPTAQGLNKPDLVASGRRVVAQRSYGSTVENENRKALISPSYIRGSGSSQAAAVTSGVAALLLSARPELTPDQVKSLLTRTADPINGVAAAKQGSGRLDLAEALTATAGPAQWQQPTATGLGSIEASRGDRRVQTDCGGDGTIDVIQGEIDVRCEPWSGSSWAGSSWAGDAWTGSSWAGSSWAGSSWAGSSWAGSSWAGSSWAGGEWTTGAYESEDDLFLTAFWGANPPAGVYFPGEAYTSRIPAGVG